MTVLPLRKDLKHDKSTDRDYLGHAGYKIKVSAPKRPVVFFCFEFRVDSQYRQINQ